MSSSQFVECLINILPTTFAVVEEVPEVLINMAVAEGTWINQGNNRGNLGYRWHKFGVRKGAKKVHAEWILLLKERLRKVLTFEPVKIFRTTNSFTDVPACQVVHPHPAM